MTERGPGHTLEAGLDELGIAASTQQIGSLLALSRLLFKWSKAMNLTGHRTVEEIVKRLVLDAVAMAVHVPEVASLADIGTPKIRLISSGAMTSRAHGPHLAHRLVGRTSCGNRSSARIHNGWFKLNAMK